MQLSSIEKLYDNQGLGSAEANIKDKFLKNEIEVLLNNWCVQTSNNEFIFFRHFNSNRKGVIYQLILSGNEYDGIYSMELFRHNLNFKNIFYKESNEIVMHVDTDENYDLAKFSKKSFTYIVDREITGEKEFKSELNKYLQQLSKYDVIDIYMDDSSRIHLNQQKLGELKFRTKLQKILRYPSSVSKIKFHRKKREYYISKHDLGESKFKKEIIRMGLVTPEEYDLYTCKNNEKKEFISRDLRKIEIF